MLYAAVLWASGVDGGARDRVMQALRDEAAAERKAEQAGVPADGAAAPGGDGPSPRQRGKQPMRGPQRAEMAGKTRNW